MATGRCRCHHREEAAAAPAQSVFMAARIQQLAQPKSRPRNPDRRSVYWLDKLPPECTGSTTKIEMTPRWLDLCRSKRVDTQIPLSPIRVVSVWALKAVPSDRLCNLGEPRHRATGWQHSRQLPLAVRRETQTAVASPRICQLARPKTRHGQEGTIQETKPARALSPLPRKSNAHIELLATPKHDHPMFKGERPVCWPISRTTRRHVASLRLLELSAPKERTALFEGYDPYVVSRAARSASPSPRVQQLCLPLPRKCVSRQES